MGADEFTARFPAEDQFVEFKQGVSARAIHDAVAAFSNADGGIILIGVSRDGQPVGISMDGELEARIHRIVAEVHSAARYDVHRLDVDGRLIVIVSVDQRREGFAQTPGGVVLVRRAAMNVKLLGDELASFVVKKAIGHFETTDTGLPWDATESGLVGAVSEAWGWAREGVQERFIERGLAARTRERTTLTVAGALYVLPGTEDDLGPLGKTYIELLRYPRAGSTYDKRLRFHGPLQQQVVEATEAVHAEIGTTVIMLGAQRHELPKLPLRVVREAVANAVAHRSYEANGTAVRIEVRPDVVLVRSPGGFPEPVTEANVREQQAARNPRVIETLRRFGLAEDAGEGVDVIQDMMQSHMLNPPTFRDSGGSVVVELPLQSTVNPEERAWIMELERDGTLRSRDRVVLIHAARASRLTNSYVRRVLGVDSVEARTVLHRLRDVGLLEQVGTRGGTTYRLTKRVGPAMRRTLSLEELARVVERLARRGALTNTVVRNELGLDRTEALRVLDLLVQQGRLRRVGRRRGTRYLPPEKDPGG